jgi:hypothetical protein
MKPKDVNTSLIAYYFYSVLEAHLKERIYERKPKKELAGKWIRHEEC